MASTINAITSGGGGIAVGGDTSGVIALQSNGTTFATGNQYGIGLGTAVPSSGIGISFPATQSASSDANTLDDYEEGTWTPADASGASLSITINRANYTKIGRLVYVFAYIEYPVNASAAVIQLSGLPFAIPTLTYPTSVLNSDSSVTALVRGKVNTSNINFYTISTSGNLSNAQFSGNFLIFNFSYQVA